MMEYGAQSVMIFGVSMMEMLCACNLDWEAVCVDCSMIMKCKQEFHELLVQVTTSIYIFRIAGNFRGTKHSWLQSNI